MGSMLFPQGVQLAVAALSTAAMQPPAKLRTAQVQVAAYSTQRPARSAAVSNKSHKAMFAFGELLRWKARVECPYSAQKAATPGAPARRRRGPRIFNQQLAPAISYPTRHCAGSADSPHFPAHASSRRRDLPAHQQLCWPAAPSQGSNTLRNFHGCLWVQHHSPSAQQPQR